MSAAELTAKWEGMVASMRADLFPAIDVLAKMLGTPPQWALAKESARALRRYHTVRKATKALRRAVRRYLAAERA